MKLLERLADTAARRRLSPRTVESYSRWVGLFLRFHRRPDGTWRQAGSTRTRVAGLAQIPCAALPPGAASQYQLRHSDVPGRISTMEAIARSLGILEDDPAVQRSLESALAMMVDRTLFLRGKGPMPIDRHDPAFK